MKIINNFNYKTITPVDQSKNKVQNKFVSTNKTNNSLANLTSSNLQGYFKINFTSQKNSSSLQQAQEYIRSLDNGKKQEINIALLDFEKLEGIQDIKSDVFKGLSIAEIIFFLNQTNLLINRGCTRGCSHCFCEAKPPIDNENTISAMSYEDLSKLCEGVEQVRENLNSACENITITDCCNFYMMFCDSDCIDIEVKDKDGNVYDYVDCLELLKQHGIELRDGSFTTAGWEATDEKSNERAQKVVKYIQKNIDDPDFTKLMGECIISINPFHSRMEQFNNTRNQKFRDEYVKMMANVLFQFTPLLEVERKDFTFGINLRYKTNEGLPTDSKYSINVVQKLFKDIVEELEKMYEADLAGDKKFIKKRKDIKKYIKSYKDPKKFGAQPILEFGRAERLFKFDPYRQTRIKNGFLDEFYTSPVLCMTSINPNGKISYSSGATHVIPTDVCLNFENKDKKTAPLGINCTAVPYSIKGQHVENQLRKYGKIAQEGAENASIAGLKEHIIQLTPKDMLNMPDFGFGFPSLFDNEDDLFGLF